MKPLTLVAAGAVVVLGGVMWYQSQGNTPVVTEVEAPQAEAPETAEPVEEAAEAVEDTATSVVDQVESAVETAQDAVEGAVEGAADAVTAVTDSAQEAVEGATDTASDIADALTDGAADLADQATSSVEAVTSETQDATDAATSLLGQAASLDSPLSLLTADGFDFDKVVDMVNGSELDVLKKTALNTALGQARDNPELLQAALDQVKSALGL